MCMGGSWGIGLRFCIVHHKLIPTLLTEEFKDVTLLQLFPFKQKNYSCGLIYIELTGTKVLFITWTI